MGRLHSFSTNSYRHDIHILEFIFSDQAADMIVKSFPGAQFGCGVKILKKASGKTPDFT